MQVEEALDAAPVAAPRRRRDELAWTLARLDAAVVVMHRLALEHESLLRTIMRLTAGGASSPGIRPRGSRRVDWLSAAVEPIRPRLGPRRFERLLSALCVCVGFDALFVLRDVRGLTPRQALQVMRWMAAVMVRDAVATPGPARGRSAPAR